MVAPAVAAAAGGGSGAAAGTAARSAASSGSSGSSGAANAAGAVASTPKASKPSTARSGGSTRRPSQQSKKGTRSVAEQKVGPAKLNKAVGKFIPGRTGASKLVIAEFIICLLVIVLAPLDKSKHADIAPKDQIKRLTALCFLFIILGLISAGGRGSARVASAVGGLVALTLLFTERNVIVTLAGKFGAKAAAEPTGTAPVAEAEYEV